MGLLRDAISPRSSRGVAVCDPEPVSAPYSQSVALDQEIIHVPDDLSREVYGLLGMPIDVIETEAVVFRVKAAAERAAPFLLSTPNLHYLANARSDCEFREVLLDSDLCPADGMPIVWLAKMLGIPIKRRTAGADIFAALKSASWSTGPLRVFLFGAAKGIAAAASRNLNKERRGLTCVGSRFPGFGTVEELSANDIIDEINSNNADLLVVCLNAAKGQAWLWRNHERLTTPVRVNLGAAINFEAGIVDRAPVPMQRWGFEWLWRIYQEPYLWQRYWRDFRLLVYVLVARVLPFAIGSWLHRSPRNRREPTLSIKESHNENSVVLSLLGAATAGQVGSARPCFEGAIATKKNVVVDLEGAQDIDHRFLGLLLMLRKQLKRQGLHLKVLGASSWVEATFRLNGFGFLLSGENERSSSRAV